MTPSSRLYARNRVWANLQPKMKKKKEGSSCLRSHRFLWPPKCRENLRARVSEIMPHPCHVHVTCRLDICVLHDSLMHVPILPNGRLWDHAIVDRITMSTNVSWHAVAKRSEALLGASQVLELANEHFLNRNRVENHVIKVETHLIKELNFKDALLLTASSVLTWWCKINEENSQH